MAKTNKTVFFCQNCGFESTKWLGQCPECKEWNTFTEEVITPLSQKKEKELKKVETHTLSEITVDAKQRQSTGMEEFDRVLGSGIVSGSLILVGGDPELENQHCFFRLAVIYHRPILDYYIYQVRNPFSR